MRRFHAQTLRPDRLSTNGAGVTPPPAPTAPRLTPQGRSGSMVTRTMAHRTAEHRLPTTVISNRSPERTESPVLLNNAISARRCSPQHDEDLVGSATASDHHCLLDQGLVIVSSSCCGRSLHVDESAHVECVGSQQSSCRPIEPTMPDRSRSGPGGSFERRWTSTNMPRMRLVIQVASAVSRSSLLGWEEGADYSQKLDLR